MEKFIIEGSKQVVKQPKEISLRQNGDNVMVLIDGCLVIEFKKNRTCVWNKDLKDFNVPRSNS